jgi:cytochrome c oxidase cbb3-type subunit III
MRRLTALAGIYTVALIVSGCAREDRRLADAARWSQPVSGGAQNPDVFPGPSAVPPANLQPQSTVSPYDSNAYMVSQGQQLYSDMNCVGCHAFGGGGIGPPLMDADWVYGNGGQDIYTSIVEGRPDGMPSYRGKLTEAQVWQLVSYVRSMSGLLRKDVSPSRADHMHVKPSEQSTPKQEKTSRLEGGNEFAPL